MDISIKLIAVPTITIDESSMTTVTTKKKSINVAQSQSH